MRKIEEFTTSHFCIVTLAITVVEHDRHRTCEMVSTMFVAETRKNANEHWRMARLNS